MLWEGWWEGKDNSLDFVILKSFIDNSLDQTLSDLSWKWVLKLMHKVARGFLSLKLTCLKSGDGILKQFKKCTTNKQALLHVILGSC